MPRFSPPANPGTRLRVGATGVYLGPGDVPIIGGVGAVPRASEVVESGLVIDTPGSAVRPPLSLFAPDLSTFPTITLPSFADTIYVLSAEAYILGATPGAADASNRWALTVAGDVSGSLDLPIIGDVREHRWAAYDVSQIGTTAAAGSSGRGFRAGLLSLCKATADLTIGTVDIKFGTSGADAGVNKLVEIIAPDGSVLAAAAPVTSGIGAGTTHRFELEQSVDIAQGDEFGVGIRLDGYTPGVTVMDVSFGKTTGYDGDIAEVDSGDWETTTTSSASVHVAYDYPAGWVWADVLPYTGDVSGITRSQPAELQLYGTGTGVEIASDLVLSVTSVGTPPATPTDVNLRIVYADDVKGW